MATVVINPLGEHFESPLLRFGGIPEFADVSFDKTLT